MCYAARGESTNREIDFYSTMIPCKVPSRTASVRLVAPSLAKIEDRLKAAKTVQGQDVKIDAAKWHLHKSIKINDANVVKPDVAADNGVIHVIDKVLLPK